jgi:transposase
MDKKTRIIIGRQGKKMVIPKPASTFTPAEKEHVILEYLNGKSSKNEIWQKYVGKTDHGRLLNWMRKLGYHTGEDKSRKDNFKQKLAVMNQEKQASKMLTDQEILSQTEWQAKVKALEQQVSQVEKKLELAQMRAEAYSTMIDIAEKEFQIPIRKK